MQNMQKLTLKSKFAEKAGVNPSTITRISKTVLAGAVQGKFIDENHPAAVNYLMQRNDPDGCARVKTKTGPAIESQPAQEPATKPEPPKPVQKPKNDRRKKTAEPDPVEEYLNYTLQEIIQRFGTDLVFNEYLKAVEKIEVIQDKRLKNAATEGRLIARDLVHVGLIDPINSAHVRLMTDGAKTLVADIIGKHESGESMELIEKSTSDIIGSFIKPVKNKIKRALKNV